MKNITYVIIAGCQRSGTTLTGHIIGAHPNAILIDDNEKEVDDFRTHGGMAILVPQPWNSAELPENYYMGAYIWEQLKELVVETLKSELSVLRSNREASNLLLNRIFTDQQR